MNRIDGTYTQFKTNSIRCESELLLIKDDLSELLKKGKIDDASYELFNNKIERFMYTIKKRIIEEDFKDVPEKLLKSIRKVLEDEVITKEEYEDICNEISKTKKITEDKKEEIINLLKGWLKD